LLASLALSAGAAAQATQVLGPYDGSNPFNCQLQNVGTGTDFPDPDADPFCVEFDKTSQNVTDFGLVEFLAQEPFRVAAAVPKCFYFQRDHWTGSIVQGQPPELWNWDGNYFFDKARGVGGVNVVNFRVLGVPQDATPFAPPAYQPFFSESGGGGVQVLLESNPDPSCAQRVDTPEEQAQVYANVARSRNCIAPGGELHGRRVGRVRLGMDRDQVLSRLGAPREFRHRVDRWCLVGSGQLRVVYGGRERTELIRTSGRGHAARGVARGDSARRALRRLELAKAFRLGDTRVFDAGSGGARRLVVGIAGHRVRWLAIADRRALKGTGALRRSLRRAR
jgi:hypothetical protein